MTLYISTHSKHTLGHHDCPACNELVSMCLSSLSPSLPFEEAAAAYMKAREIEALPDASSTAHFIKSNTIVSYHQYIESLKLFFVSTPLSNIRPETMRAYQIARLNGHPPFVRYRRPQDAKERIVNGIVIPPKGKVALKVKPKKIKQELNLLITIMKLSGAWTPDHERIFGKNRRGHLVGDDAETRAALTAEQQAQWITTARSHERWNVIFWWSLIAFHTSASTNELRALRIGDVNLHHQVISVPWPGVKCKGRRRTITIDDADCLWALEQLLIRARELGAKEATDYLFPFYKAKKYDPKRPMTVSGLKSRWNEVRKETGFNHFTPYSARHTAITREAEKGTPIAIIKARAGHLSSYMSEHYTHISEVAQRRRHQPPIQSQYASQQQWWPPAELPPSIRPTGPRVIMFMGKQMIVPA